MSLGGVVKGAVSGVMGGYSIGCVGGVVTGVMGGGSIGVVGGITSGVVGSGSREDRADLFLDCSAVSAELEEVLSVAAQLVLLVVHQSINV